MKLRSIFEARRPDNRALFKAGIECSTDEFKENFDAIIDFQDRLNKMYDDIEEKLGAIRYEDDPGFDVPQVHSTVSIYPNNRGEWTSYAWWYLNKEADDYELTFKVAKSYIERMFKKYTPELHVAFEQQRDDEGYIEFSVEWKEGEPLSKLKVFYSAPEPDDSKHANSHRKALKWW